jgi:formylglycine-generating enzyme required for sulfatase activity
MNKILLLSLLALGYQSASAESLLESFGSGANAFTMEYVTIGNAGNAADKTGSPNPVGAVNYTFNLGKYEVSRDQIIKANASASLGITLFDLSNFGGNGLLKPATGINWYEAAKFVNWLNTSTGGTEAYKFSGGSFQLWSAGDSGYNPNNKFRNSNAKYWIASQDEWYKGAYGSPNGSWSDFSNRSDIAPNATASGITDNTAVYSQPMANGPADIYNAGGLSAFGTMGQGGNAQELNETAMDGINSNITESRGVRGGAWYHGSNDLNSSYAYGSLDASTEYGDTGFRVASSVPEPSALSLLAVGLGGLAMMRRRRS